jgi:hypothetical protein
MESTLAPQARVHSIRLFFSGSPQVALYGSPSMVDDGWMANLPASEIFAGDIGCLLFEVLINAQDAHQRVGFQDKFYELHVMDSLWSDPSPEPEASQSNALASQALQHLTGARGLAIRLAQQARGEERSEDQQRWLSAAAALTMKAADLQGDD